MLSSAIRCTYPLKIGKREESLPLASGWVRQWPVAGLGSDSSEGKHSPLWTCARVVRNSIIFYLAGCDPVSHLLSAQGENVPENKAIM